MPCAACAASRTRLKHWLTRVLPRGFGVHTDGPYPHLLVEHLEGPTLRR